MVVLHIPEVVKVGEVTQTYQGIWNLLLRIDLGEMGVLGDLGADLLLDLEVGITWILLFSKY